MKVLVANFNKKKALVGTFSGLCETSRRFVGSSNSSPVAMLRTLEKLVTARSENRVMNAAASPLPHTLFAVRQLKMFCCKLSKLTIIYDLLELWVVYISYESFFSQFNCYLGKYWNLVYTFEDEIDKKYWCVWPVCLYIAKISCLPIGFFICLLLVVRDDQSWQCAVVVAVENTE